MNNLTNNKIMTKTKYLFLAALTSLVLIGCTSDEYLGNDPATPQEPTAEPIRFSSGATTLTRADLYGSAAAEKLGNTFVVFGTKHISPETASDANDAVAYNNFQVKWTASTAGTTPSNTSDWDYVGLQSYDATPTSQGLKYWDQSAINGYTFTAFSYHRSDDPTAPLGITYPADQTNDDVYVSKVRSDGTSLYNKGYAVSVKPTATLNNLYFSDRTPVAKTAYGNTVSLTFRNLGSRVRVGFYETIPGYTVKIDRFYIDEGATAVVTDFAKMNNAKTDAFHAAFQNVNRTAAQTLNVTYYNSGADINRAKVSNPTSYVYDLKLGNGLINTTLADKSSDPTWDNGGAYTPVYPFEGNSNPMLLKIDFTMTADDGSDDVIHVRGARAIVPVEYTQWKSNFAYTYIFKISDKTNGTTGNVDDDDEPTDPEGLQVITFDAIVVDITEERQETITTVSDNSITTYAKGAIANEYNAGAPVYVALYDGTTHAVIEPTGIGNNGGYAQVYTLNKAASEAEIFAKLIGSPIDGLTLTANTTASVETEVPLVDGTTAAIANVKFTPEAAGYYAYVYTRQKYEAPTYTNQTAGTYDSSETYYMRSDNGVYYAVSVTSEAAFNANKDNLFIQSVAGIAGQYDIKVIKVQ